ncbi:MAG: NADPH:quinone oxidoreductase family protein [Alphaproteobacteria bacterium]|nr:NADPH:quinone oxidoreductase family protein [Alphaproteobacteria bacterium]
MRAVICKQFGDPADLVLEAVAPPDLEPGTVRVDVHACGLNFADSLIIQGKYQVKPTPPFAPGMEVAGVVSECGAGVETCAPGDRVIGMMSYGGLAEQAVVEAARVVPMPDSMDFVSGAAFPVVYGTSHVALDRRARLRPGEVLLVLGAAGGVGLSAVEIGKIMGARVIAAASSPEKLAVAKAHGADLLIDYTKENLREKVKEMCGGADVIYDPVGGDALGEALRCINWEGRLIVIGFASGTIPRIPANYLLLKNCAAVGLFWGAYAKRDPAVVRASFETLLGWYTDKKFAPHVSHRLPLERATEALALITGRTATGKVVVTTGRD